LPPFFLYIPPPYFPFLSLELPHFLPPSFSFLFSPTVPSPLPPPPPNPAMHPSSIITSSLVEKNAQIASKGISHRSQRLPWVDRGKSIPHPFPLRHGEAATVPCHALLKVVFSRVLPSWGRGVSSWCWGGGGGIGQCLSSWSVGRGEEGPVQLSCYPPLTHHHHHCEGALLRTLYRKPCLGLATLCHAQLVHSHTSWRC
jgi:hypothetical protein